MYEGLHQQGWISLISPGVLLHLATCGRVELSKKIVAVVSFLLRALLSPSTSGSCVPFMDIVESSHNCNITFLHPFYTPLMGQPACIRWFEDL